MKHLTHFNIAILLALVFIFLVAVFRPAGGNIDTGVSRDEFWYHKIHAKPEYDFVLAGDSRIMCDLSPSAIETVLDLKTFNFGFNFAGYSEEYLDAVESKIAVNSKTKVILLGITPRSLTPLNIKVSAFARESKKKGYELFKQKYLSDFFDVIRPVSLATTFSQIKGKRFYRNHYTDGFMSVELDPPNPHQDLPTYLKIFNNNAVDDSEYLLADGSHVNATDVDKFSTDIAESVATVLAKFNN